MRAAATTPRGVATVSTAPAPNARAAPPACQEPPARSHAGPASSRPPGRRARPCTQDQVAEQRPRLDVVRGPRPEERLRVQFVKAPSLDGGPGVGLGAVPVAVDLVEQAEHRQDEQLLVAGLALWMAFRASDEVASDERSASRGRLGASRFPARYSSNSTSKDPLTARRQLEHHLPRLVGCRRGRRASSSARPPPRKTGQVIDIFSVGNGEALRDLRHTARHRRRGPVFWVSEREPAVTGPLQILSSLHCRALREGEMRGTHSKLLWRNSRRSVQEIKRRQGKSQAETLGRPRLTIKNLDHAAGRPPRQY